MSFVAGFVTGMTTGGAIDRRHNRSHLREYLQSHGYTVIDEKGQPVSIDTIIEEAIPTHRKHRKPGKAILVTGAALVAVVILTGGSAWAAVAAAS
jgi:hypothetical protein